MLCINNKDIRLSRGDTLDISFTVKGINIDSEDIVTITVKGNGICIQKSFIGVVDNTIPFFLTSEETAQMPVGKYFYDLLVENDYEKKTLNWPYRLIIEGVVRKW